MKKLCRIAFSLLLLAGCTASYATAQAWDTYASEEFDIQFDVPSGWITEVDGDILISTGDGIVLVVAAVKDESISTQDLFKLQVESLDLEAEGEYEEIELLGGMLGIIGSGAGVIEGEVVGIILLAATLDENNYVAYIYALPEAFDEHQDTMVDIITSLAPLGWEVE